MELSKTRDSRRRRITTVGKFVVYYSIVIVSLVWIADIFVKWSIPHLLELLFLLIFPSFVSGFLIYESRRNFPKANTWLFIGAAEFHLVFVTLVIVYEAFQLDDVAPSTIDGIVIGVVVGSLVVAAALYKRIKALTGSKETIEIAH